MPIYPDVQVVASVLEVAPVDRSVLSWLPLFVAAPVV
jgi:hypothetical protein